MGTTFSGMDRYQLYSLLDALRTNIPQGKTKDFEELLKTAQLEQLTPLQKDDAIEIAKKTEPKLRALYLEQLKEAKDQDAKLSGKEQYVVLSHNVYWQTGEIELDSQIDKYDEKEKEKIKEIRRVMDKEISKLIFAEIRYSSPMGTKIPVVISPTRKPLGTSTNIFRQIELAGQGYLWEDYYRPMSFNSVLISLIRKNETAPMRKVLDHLRSAGVVAGALVGLDSISSTFDNRSFVDVVAVTTGVVLPELRQLLLDDINQHITNLAELGLERVIEIDPLKSVDGYVFFPRGPIYGYGVDEFSLKQPTFIANIDNVDVAVDGVLVEKSQSIASGEKDALITAATGRIESLMSADAEKQRRMQERLRAFRLSSVVEEVQQALKQGKTELADAVIRDYEALYGNLDMSGTLARLRGEIEEKKVAQKQTDETAMIQLQQSKNGEKKPVSTIVLKSEDVGNALKKQFGEYKYFGIYQIRLDHEISSNKSVYSAIHVEATMNDKNLPIEIAAKQVDKDGKLTLKWESSLMVKFNEKATADDPWDHAWFEPYFIYVKVKEEILKGSEVEIKIIHTINSADHRFNGTKTLRATIPEIETDV